jgi:site-specific DNA-methyltransferase (adenine-specific)
VKCLTCRCRLDARATGRKPRYCSPACKQSAYRVRRQRSVHFSSASCEWSTPPELFAELDREFSFTLDVCATADNAKCARFYSRAEDGLAQPWTGRVFCNPPYGRSIGKWLERAREAAQSGEADLVVCLVPARVDTSWWHDTAATGEVRFLRGRIRFGGTASGAPFPSAVVVFKGPCGAGDIRCVPECNPARPASFRNAQDRYETSVESA